MKTLKTEKISKIQILAIVGALLGIGFAVTSHFVPEIVLFGDVVYNFLIATGIEGLCAIAGTFKGYRKITETELDKIKSKSVKKEVDAKFKELLKEKEEAIRTEAEALVTAESLATSETPN